MGRTLHKSFSDVHWMVRCLRYNGLCPLRANALVRLVFPSIRRRAAGTWGSHPEMVLGVMDDWKNGLPLSMVRTPLQTGM